MPSWRKRGLIWKRSTRRVEEIKFEILIGPDDGRIVEFEEERVRVGRKSYENDLVQSHDKIMSKSHAQVRQADDGFLVTDMNSKHGTYVRGRVHLRSEEAELRLGDILILGKTWLRFLG